MINPEIIFPRAPDSRNNHFLRRYLRMCFSIRSLSRVKCKRDGLEKHRILPKCMGGTYNPENVVLTTRREHTVLHLVLHKAFPTNIKLAECASLMNGSKGSKFYKSLEYCQKNEEKSKRIAESNRRREVSWGHKISSSLKGRTKDKEHRGKISSTMKEVWKNNPTMIDKCSRKNSTHSDESKRKISCAISKQRWYWKIEGTEVIRTRSEKHPGEGWQLGRNPR